MSQLVIPDPQRFDAFQEVRGSSTRWRNTAEFGVEGNGSLLLLRHNQAPYPLQLPWLVHHEARWLSSTATFSTNVVRCWRPACCWASD